MIEETLVNVLQTAGLTVYPGSIPARGSYPCVVYQKISNPLIRTHVGNALEYPRFQLTCWGRGETAASQAITTAETVKTAIDLNQIDFKLATKESELDIDETEQGLYRRILDFFIWHD